MHRMSIRYIGRVQGVGFRAAVAEAAQGFQVFGRVANVADGSVDLQAEGDEVELQEFRQAIATRMSRLIVDTHESWSEITQPKWDDFRIAADLP